ncbi:MAG TPA: holo-ACP synthase [Rhabdochlamydiaceae bacterium]|jgi:holo-[acyl-carrier protein] synthase
MTNANHAPILGIGNDIIEIDRIRKSIDTHGLRLLSRLFTTKEQDYCLKHKDPVPHFAGRFSAKEAIVKALGTGFGEHASWLDMEILNDEKGKPCVHFSASLEKKLKDSCVLVSISHCELYVTAFALWMKKSL